MGKRFRDLLATPAHPASLAAFRFGYGWVIVWMLIDHLRPHPTGRTWMQQLFDAAPEPFYFSYPGLEWWQPISLPVMESIAWLGVVSSISLAIGFATRWSAFISFASVVYLMTSDAHLYGNHIALALVYSFLLVWMPSGHAWSVDAWLRGRGWLSSDPVPFASLFTLRVQTFLVYFFGGVAKIHPDWLAGEPMQTWFRGGSTATMVRDTIGAGLADGLILPLLARHETALFFSWGGLIFDLTIGVLLILRRTRPLALGLATFFHGFNFLFINNVGLVAVMAFWATLVFCEPDWPVRLGRWLRQPTWRAPDLGWFVLGMILLPVAGVLLGWRSIRSGWLPGSLPLRRAVPPAILLWSLLATLVPLRHFFIAGDVLFTAEGTAFSWFLMTCNKEGDYLRFEVIDPKPTGLETKTWTLVDVGPTTQFPPPDELLVTCEPLLGHRVFVRPSSSANRANMIQRWRQDYGRSPQLQPTVTTSEFFQQIRQRTRPDKEVQETPGINDGRVANVESLRQQMLENTHDPARQRVLYHLLHYQLQWLARELQSQPELLSLLCRVSPFAWQPATSNVGEEPWMLVVDPDLSTPSRHPVFFEIDPTTWKGTTRVFCQIDYLPHAYWPLWGRITPIERDGQISSYLWNDTFELNEHQVKALGYFPYLLAQYSRHLADRWLAEQGRYPVVRVTSYLWLNHHDFQPLVDPEADLGRAQYHLFRHNAWIRDYQRRSAPQ